MDERQREPLSLDASAVLERVKALAPEATRPVLAFDGDGTLWAGDVGEDVFHAAVKERLLRETARAGLIHEAERYGLAAHGDANELAERLFGAYLEQRYPERNACAMMTWCYAGMRRAELVELAERTFVARGLSARYHRELAPILDFARATGMRTVVVSASPEPIVEVAARGWGLALPDIAASRAREEAGRIAPELARPVPYAEGKPLALQALVGDSTLLAAFGDNAFDVELFLAARLAVAVRPKPALRRRFHEVPCLCVLSEANEER